MWTDDWPDKSLVEALQSPTDYDAVFEYGLSALAGAAAESRRRRVAPHSPTPMPTTAPPSPIDLLRALHLVVDTHPAQQVGRVGPARGQEPAAGVLTAERRRHQQPADQRVAVAH